MEVKFTFAAVYVLLFLFVLGGLACGHAQASSLIDDFTVPDSLMYANPPSSIVNGHAVMTADGYVASIASFNPTNNFEIEAQFVPQSGLGDSYYSGLMLGLNGPRVLVFYLYNSGLVRIYDAGTFYDGPTVALGGVNTFKAQAVNGLVTVYVNGAAVMTHGISGSYAGQVAIHGYLTSDVVYVYHFKYYDSYSAKSISLAAQTLTPAVGSYDNVTLTLNGMVPGDLLDVEYYANGSIYIFYQYMNGAWYYKYTSGPGDWYICPSGWNNVYVQPLLIPGHPFQFNCIAHDTGNVAYSSNFLNINPGGNASPTPSPGPCFTPWPCVTAYPTVTVFPTFNPTPMPTLPPSPTVPPSPDPWDIIGWLKLIYILLGIFYQVVLNFIGWVQSVAGWLYSVFMGFVAWLGATLGAIIGQFQGWINQLLSGLTDIKNSIGNIQFPVIPNPIDILTSIYNSVLDIPGDVETFIFYPVVYLGSIFIGLVNLVLGTFMGFLNDIAAIFAIAWGDDAFILGCILYNGWVSVMVIGAGIVGLLRLYWFAKDIEILGNKV